MMNTDRAKYSKNMAIISLVFVPGSILLLVLSSVIPAEFLPPVAEDVIYLTLFGLACAMQIAAFVLGIIAVKYKPSGLSITALVISIVVIVLEVVFVAMTIWMIMAACNALVDFFDSPELRETLDGCASMGTLLWR